MKNFNIVFLLLLVYPWMTWSQSTEKYRGTMPTRIASNGEVTYYFTRGANQEEVKNGSFKYRLRQTRGFSKIYQDVNGNYVSGQKEGRWSFRTTFKDYKDDRGTEYLSGTMTLSAEYVNGNPTGSWNFKYTYKTREIEGNNGGRIQWESYNEQKNVLLSFKLANLKLVDSLYMKTDDGRGAEGILDENGFFTGNWNLDNNNKFIRELYDEGLLYKKEIYNKQDTLLVKAYDYSDVEMGRRDNIKSLIGKNPQKIYQLHYTLDTLSVLSQNHVIKSILTDWIFENPYLLFRELDGDNYDPQDLSGGYVVQVVNQVTPEQQAKLDELENLQEEFKQVNIRLQNLTRGKSITDRTKSTIQLMTYHERMAEKYVCLANSITSLPDLNDAKNVCQQNCKNTIKLTTELPEFHSRDEALSFFLNDLNEKSQSMHAYENMLRKEMELR